jgi:hypothetical protein
MGLVGCTGSREHVASEVVPIIPAHRRSICERSAMAPPKPSVHTRFMLDAMTSEGERENNKLDQILERVSISCLKG